MKRAYVIINEKGVPFINNGQCWMYRNNLVESVNCNDGDIVDIYDEANKYLATGFYSAVSHIVVRIFDRNNLEDYGEVFFKELLKKAINYRQKVMGDNFDNCRLVYGQADGLPGLIIDRYDNILVSQISCVAVEKRKEMFYRLTSEILTNSDQFISGIYERNDVKVREKEGLPLEKGFYHGIKMRPIASIYENGINIIVDIENGQKTGYFLDQKDNRLTVRNLSEGKKVLDCFCHTGGFSLNAAYGNAAKVVGVDVSKTALQQALNNAINNGLEEKISFVQADVFEYLNQIKKGEFDIIILDPPAFSKSPRTIDHAFNGYKEINAKAMSLLNKGSLLVTCSCSRFMEKENFERMLEQAGQQANVDFSIIHYASASKDHPISLDNKESEYLKFYVLQIN